VRHQTFIVGEASSAGVDDASGAGVGEVSGAGGVGEASQGAIGILGGSFNPPHRGHAELARCALRELGLARVLLMPARISPGKPLEEEPNPACPEHRLAMCRLAAAGLEGVEACALEVEREGPSYTVDTLRALHAAHPATALTFVLGADVATTLPTWHEAPELPRLARFAVARRPDAKQAAGSADRQAAGPVGEQAADALGFSIVHLRMPLIEVSSSRVRERVRRGLPVEDLVEPAVAAYIAEHGLYRVAIGAPPS
jgi:nicotinate-nucleotide adenylyltransferase